MTVLHPAVTRDDRGDPAVCLDATACQRRFSDPRGSSVFNSVMFSSLLPLRAWKQQNVLLLPPSQPVYGDKHLRYSAEVTPAARPLPLPLTAQELLMGSTFKNSKQRSRSSCCPPPEFISEGERVRNSSKCSLNDDVCPVKRIFHNKRTLFVFRCETVMIHYILESSLESFNADSVAAAGNRKWFSPFINMLLTHQYVLKEKKTFN